MGLLKGRYLSQSMTSSVQTDVFVDETGHHHPALAIKGHIGAAATEWLRETLDQAHLAPGDLVLLSSPGGDLGQALIMGELIRSRALATAVGTFDGSGTVQPSYCASACVLVYAGGKDRVGLPGSKLGVHRFTTSSPGSDPVADTQRTAGLVLNYLTKMGISSAVAEAMSSTSDVRWLSEKEMADTHLVTTTQGER